MGPRNVCDWWTLGRVLFLLSVILNCTFVSLVYNEQLKQFIDKVYSGGREAPILNPSHVVTNSSQPLNSPPQRSNIVKNDEQTTPNTKSVQTKALPKYRNLNSVIRYHNNVKIVNKKIPFPRNFITVYDDIANKTVNYTLEYDKDYGIFLIERKPVIWTFWDYTPMPSYIQVFIATINCFNRPAGLKYIVTNDRFARDNFPEHISPHFDKMQYANRADIVRGYILLYFGGMWMDADTFGLQSLRPVFDYLKQDYDMFNIDWRPEEKSPLAMGVLGPVKAQSPLFITWHWEVSSVIAEYEAKWKTGSGTIGWNWVLGAILIPAAKILEAENKAGNLKFRFKWYDGPGTWGQLMRYEKTSGMFSEEFKAPKKFVDPVANASRTGRVAVNQTELLFMSKRTVPAHLASQPIATYINSNKFLPLWNSLLLCKCLDLNKDYFAKELSRGKILSIFYEPKDYSGFDYNQMCKT